MLAEITAKNFRVLLYFAAPFMYVLLLLSGTLYDMIAVLCLL